MFWLGMKIGAVSFYFADYFTFLYSTTAFSHSIPIFYFVQESKGSFGSFVVFKAIIVCP